MTSQPDESHSEALAELRDAVNAFLRADLDALLPLVVARDRATALLGDQPYEGGGCNCNVASGWHSPDCALVGEAA